MSGKNKGFTIVELLIVIVVIAILAAISIVAYTGIQQRARDSSRTAAVQQIQKSLEAYRAVHGRYPPQVSIGTGANVPEGLSPAWGSGYEYSVDERDNWMQALVDASIVSEVPRDPVNDNDHYFAYFSTLSIGACNEPMYMLAVVGYEDSANIPESSKSLNCSVPGTTAHWTTQPSRAIFSNIPR